MCWMAAVPIAMAAVNTVSSSVSSYQSAKAQNRSLEHSAQVNQQNAYYARQEASYARYQAGRNAEEKRKETAQLIGAQRAKMGASGAVVDAGSFMDVTLSTAEEGEKGAVAMLQEGDMESWRHELRAGQYQRQADTALASRVNPSSILAGSLLTGAANTALTAFTMSKYFGDTPAPGSPGIFNGTPLSPGWNDNSPYR